MKKKYVIYSLTAIKSLQFFVYFLCLAGIMCCFWACSTNSHFENDKLWLNHQYKNFNYYDTNYADTQINNFVVNGSVLQSQNKYAEAILEFQQALQYDSVSPAVYYAIAKSYLKLEKFDLAIANSLKSLKFADNFVPAYDLLAEAYLRKTDITNAIFSLETANKIEETEQRLLSLAKIYEYQDIKKSLKYYKKSAKKFPNEYVYVQILDLSRQTNDSILYYETLAELAKTSAGNVTYSGELILYYLQTAKYDSLITLCNKMDLEAKTKDLEQIYGTLLNSFLRDSLTPKKVKAILLKKIDNRFYFNWQVNFLAGNNALSLADTAKSEVFFNRVLQNSDTIYDLPLEVAFSYQNFGYNQKSLDLLKKLTTEKPENWIYPFYISVKYHLGNELEKSLEYALIALDRNNSQIDIIAQIAGIYELQKDYENADKYFEQALKIDYKNALVNNNYAYSLCNRGDENLQLALKHSEIAIKIDSTNPAYLDTYGWINYNLGNYYVALEFVSKAIEFGEKSAEVWEHLADIYLHLGKLQEAAETYDKALKLEPKNEKLIQKKQNLL